jgi:DNA repair protein RadC
MIGRTICGPSDVAPSIVALLQAEPSEVLVVLCLSTKRRVIGFNVVSRGTLDQALAFPREVFRAALLSNAASIILAHNHPSGDPTPSPADRLLTARLVSAGEILGIPLDDHFVVGDGTWVSFRNLGLLPWQASSGL